MTETPIINAEFQFNHNDIIWAKVAGHPWWPGIVSLDAHLLRKQLYRVDFFGDPPSHSILPSNKIIRYAQFDKSLNNGRASPQLKRAISQASILHTTLQQSKHSLEHLHCSLPLDAYDPNNLQFPQLKVVEKSASCTQKEESKVAEHRPLVSEDTVISAPRGRPKTKKIHRPVAPENRHIEKERRHQKNKEKEQVRALLRKYRLESIPKLSQEQSRESVDVQKLLSRKLYKILRLHRAASPSQQQALTLSSTIKQASDFKAFLKNLVK